MRENRISEDVEEVRNIKGCIHVEEPVTLSVV
jgi:hypothetical protein